MVPIGTEYYVTKNNKHKIHFIAFYFAWFGMFEWNKINLKKNYASLYTCCIVRNNKHKHSDNQNQVMYTDEYEYTTTFCSHFNRHIDLFNTNSINNLKIIVRKSKPTGSAAISQSFDNHPAQIDAVVGIHSAHAVVNNHSAHAAVNNHSSMGVLLYNLVEFQSCRVCIYN